MSIEVTGPASSSEQRQDSPAKVHWLPLVAGLILTLIGLGVLVSGIWALAAEGLGFGDPTEDFESAAIGFTIYLVLAAAFGGFGLAMLRSSGIGLVERIPLIGKFSLRQLITLSVIAWALLFGLVILLIVLLTSIPVE